ALLDRQHLGAHHARERRPVDEPDDQHQYREAGTEHPQDRQVEDDVGDGDERVDYTHDDGVDGSAVVAGRQPQGDADGGGHHHADEADQQRDARAVDQAAEDV